MSFLGQGEVLLHIGSPKTGTSALQSALSQNKPLLRAEGIRYPGRQRSHWKASCSFLGDPITMHAADPPADPEYWQQLVRQVAGRPARAVVSSEGFVDTPESRIPEVIDDLGGDSVKVLLTVRALSLVLPSMWQQSLKAGAPKPLPGVAKRVKSRVVKPYDAWLERVLAGRENKDRFWTRFDYGGIVERWARVVGPGNVVVVVVDPADPIRLLTDVESLLGLSDGALEYTPAGSNRSFGREEAAFVREWLRSVELSQNLPTAEYHDWIRRGALWGLVDGRRPGANEHAIGTPAWADGPISELTQAATRSLQASGVHLVGDLDNLAVSTPAGASDRAAGDLREVPADVAIELLNGILSAAATTARKLAEGQ